MSVRLTFRVFLIVLILLLGLASTFFFLRSRMDLLVSFQLPHTVDDDAVFQFQIYTQDLSYNYEIGKKNNQILIPGMKYGLYTISLTHQGMNILRSSHNFQPSFGFLREETSLPILVPELSRITHIHYQLNDPWIQIRWQVQNQLELKPFQYRVQVGHQQWMVSANFLEVDARGLLEGWDQGIPIRIEPINRLAQRLGQWEETIPLSLEVLRMDFPPQFDPFEMHVEVFDQRFQLDPYLKTIHFPLLDTATEVPIRIVYYDEPILDWVLTHDDFAQPLIIPEIPFATVTEAYMTSEGLLLSLDRESDFLSNYFDSYLIEWLDQEATTTKQIIIPSDANQYQLLITPQYGLGVTSKTTVYEKYAPPKILLGTLGQTEDENARIHVASISQYSIITRYRINRGDWIDIGENESRSIITLPYRSADVLRFDVEVQDQIGQMALSGKWIDPKIPCSTEFSAVRLTDEMLFVDWLDMPEVYDSVHLVLSDGSRIHSFPVSEGPFQIDLNTISLQGPFRVILRGLLEEKEFTMAVRENVQR